LVVVPLALAIILFLLFLAFGDLSPALVMFLNVPFAVTGSVAALAFRDPGGAIFRSCRARVYYPWVLADSIVITDIRAGKQPQREWDRGVNARRKSPTA
jgi:hypothetical protein